jgi:uncharacterized protein (TIGR02679 family)
MTLPSSLRNYLAAPGLAPLWQRIRERLERTGHAIAGSVRIQLDAAAAEQVSGLLGRQIQPGMRTLTLTELDAALRRSSAAKGLVSVIAELTGGPLRDRPSERQVRDAAIAELWAHVEETMTDTGLAAYSWTREWISWLHTSGLLVRAGSTRAEREFDTAARALAIVLAGRGLTGRMLGQLATEVAGDAHALDNDRLAGRLAVRGLSISVGSSEPTTPRLRMLLWESAGVAVDTISSTVVTWGLRPPGGDRWSAMMRERADLGLVTHLTMRELTTTPHSLAAPAELVSACENPQVLQRIADAGVDRPMVCFSGNPSVVGLMLAERVQLRYHADFDWPGIAIAARLVEAGVLPWRISAQDYVDAVEISDARLQLVGRAVATPWDPLLGATMGRIGLAVHEESLLPLLLGDLTTR